LFLFYLKFCFYFYYYLLLKIHLAFKNLIPIKISLNSIIHYLPNHLTNHFMSHLIIPLHHLLPLILRHLNFIQLNHRFTLLQLLPALHNLPSLFIIHLPKNHLLHHLHSQCLINVITNFNSNLIHLQFPIIIITFFLSINPIFIIIVSFSIFE